MMTKQDQKTLILEDDFNLGQVLLCEFRDIGHEVTLAHELAMVPNLSFDYAVVDLRLSGENGLNIISKLKANNTLCKIVVLTGFGSIATAVDAMKLGATNYLTKPAGFEQILNALELTPIKTSCDEKKVFKLNSLSRNEYEYINFVLNQNKGNVSKTAKDLGLHRQSLQRKLKKLP